MNRKIITAIILALFIIPFLGSEELVYKYNKGDTYKIFINVYQNIFYNGEQIGSAEYKNKIAVKITEVKEAGGLWSGHIQILKKTSENPVFHIDDESEVTLWRDAGGYYEYNPQSLYPLLRDVPVFPGKNLEPGDTWQAEGKEFHDFRDFDIQLPVEVPVMVHYTYKQNTTIDNVKIAVITFHYEVKKELTELKYLPGRHPVFIYGKAQLTYYWDIEKGRLHSYKDTFDMIYFLNTEEVWEWVGTSEGILAESPIMKRKKMKADIEKIIKKEKIKDISVNADDQGVTITLENINFGPESDILHPEEQLKLKKIASFLKGYPHQDILIAGHTALAGTEQGQLELSDKRAKAVGEYLYQLGLRNYILFKGYGAQFPVADNSTEAGMRKNRRVEIKILEN